MTAPTIRQGMIDVAATVPLVLPRPIYMDPWHIRTVDALLASPLADIIDLAADWAVMASNGRRISPEVRALLADWRANRES